MSVLTAEEERTFAELVAQFATPRVNPVAGSLGRIRRPVLLTIWVVSLLGTFGIGAGVQVAIACGFSLVTATIAILADALATTNSHV